MRTKAAKKSAATTSPSAESDLTIQAAESSATVPPTTATATNAAAPAGAATAAAPAPQTAPNRPSATTIAPAAPVLDASSPIAVPSVGDAPTAADLVARFHNAIASDPVLNAELTSRARPLGTGTVSAPTSTVPGANSPIAPSPATAAPAGALLQLGLPPVPRPVNRFSLRRLGRSPVGP